MAPVQNLKANHVIDAWLKYNNIAQQKKCW